MAESNRLLIETLRGTIAALVGCRSTCFGDGPSNSLYSNVAGLHQLFRLLPPKYVYPDFLLSIVILKTSEPRGGLDEKAYVY